MHTRKAENTCHVVEKPMSKIIESRDSRLDFSLPRFLPSPSPNCNSLASSSHHTLHLPRTETNRPRNASKTCDGIPTTEQNFFFTTPISNPTTRHSLVHPCSHDLWRAVVCDAQEPGTCQRTTWRRKEATLTAKRPALPDLIRYLRCSWTSRRTAQSSAL